MNFNISTNGYKVVSHGTVILYDVDSELKISVEASEEFSFDVILQFIKTDSGKIEVKKEISNETIITFKCLNFENNLGSGTAKPLPIATVAGKDLLLHFWSYLMGKNHSTRKVEYTFLEKE